MDDITPATRRMTYAELGSARGISAKSAERLVQRRRWPRQIGNDGIARVLVPLGEDHVTPRRQGPTSVPDVADRGVSSSPDIGDLVREAIRDVVSPVCAQLERSEQEVATLRAELVELRIAEQASANLAEYGTAQAVDLRKRLEAAEKCADEERDRADRASAQIGELQTALTADKLELNRRLDRAEDERRELLSALSTAQAQVRQLTDRRQPQPAPRRSWLPWWRR